MCNICLLTQNFDPRRHAPGAPAFANITETHDAAESTSTTYSMTPGDTFYGTISNADDEDWIRIALTAGTTYEVSHAGIGLSDPYLRIYDASGNQIAYDDDGGDGYDALLSFTPTTGGTYYISADAYGSDTGSYALSVSESAPPPPPAGGEGTLAQLARYLQEGAEGISRTFDTSLSTMITVNLSGLTTEGRQLARWAMEAWEMVVNLDFVEVSSGEMITVDDEDSGAFAYYPNSGSTSIAEGDNTNGVELNIAQDWLPAYGTTLDSYSFRTFVHEFGHTIGLHHLGDYDASQGAITYENSAYFSNDSWQISAMSYFSQTDNTSINASYAYTSGAMMADILAIQDFYGPPDADSATAGDTIYGQGSNLGNYMDQIFAWFATGATSANVTGNPMAFTVYDRDGIDSFDFSFMTEAARLDMRVRQFSDFGSAIGIMGIAHNTIIEHAITGSGNDTVTGNVAANRITTNGGHDLVLGGDGHDTVHAGEGSDTVHGGNGRDLVFLNQGDDVFHDNAQGGALGRDTVWAGLGDDTIEGGNGDDLFHGQEGNDLIHGRLGNDLIFGGDQSDTVHAGEGSDTVHGGNGRDLVYLNQGNDVFHDNAQGGALGRDTVFAGLGDDTIEGGNGDDLFHGEAGADLIHGRLGNDRIFGGDQSDTVHAGEGSDTVHGGNGRDLVFLNQGNDVFHDNAQGGDLGRDTVWAGLGNDTIEGGNGGDLFHGQEGNDLIHGRLGNDSLYGGDQSDTIHGGEGNDLIYGGNGQDRIYMGGGNDRYIDTGQGGDLGRDTITGGPGEDSFVFGPVISQDVITDFTLGVDELALASGLVGALSAAQVADAASVTDTGVLLDFGAGQSILLLGLSHTRGLAEDIDIF